MTGPRTSAQVTDFAAGDGVIGFGPVPQIVFRGREPWSFELWANFDALTDRMDLVTREGEFALQTRSRALWAARTGQPVVLTTDDVLEHHRWYHIAVTFDGFTMTAYLDGRRLGFVTVPDGGVAPTGKPLVLGSGFYGWSTGFRAWNTAVVPAKVYRHQWAPYPAGTPGLIGQVDLTRWPPVDTSGGDLPITPGASGVGPVVLTPAAALGGAASFCDPYNDGSINPGASQWDFSVLAWVNPARLGTSQVIFSNGPVGGPGMRLALESTGAVSLRVGDGETVTSTARLDVGAWTSVACTWSVAAATTTLYVAGEPAGTGYSATGKQSPTGTPVIGGMSDPAARPLPSANFFGSIQSVDVWNRVLTAAEVVRYQTEDPTTDQACVAAWSLTPPLPQNTVTRNPIGIVGDTAVRALATPGTTGEPGMWATCAPTSGTPPTGTLPDAATLDAWVAEFRTRWADLDEVDELADRLRHNLDEVAAQVSAGTFRVPFDLTTERLPDGRTRVLLHAEGQTAVVHEGEFDPCTEWAIWFIIALGGAVYQVFGFGLNLSKVGAGLTNYLGMSLRTPGLVAGLRAAFAAGVTPTAVFDAMQLLWQLGLLMPLIRTLREAATASLTFWTVLSLGGRLLLLFGPSAPLEIALFITELGVAAYNVHNQWTKRPAGCWS
ncbi:LamG domain-containing protein [Saccharothrix yanglingensis]|uniref:LamG domain-containing protein n=1 Tax=Saccharothrix yanglingensis TaxID=659496 RepID=UPI0027D30AF3|nr:LamG-like jellyroll fold domain-containing protein [Saccharothrix yanglingensis]